jgi:uncharacterized metal-binding protein
MEATRAHWTVKPLPVLYACQGCPRFGQRAREVAALVERAGLAETAWLGTPGLEPKARFPILALDGCAEGCAVRWLAQRGAFADRHYVLDSAEARRGFAAIAADLQP